MERGMEGGQVLQESAREHSLCIDFGQWLVIPAATEQRTMHNVLTDGLLKEVPPEKMMVPFS